MYTEIYYIKVIAMKNFVYIKPAQTKSNTFYVLSWYPIVTISII